MLSLRKPLLLLCILILPLSACGGEESAEDEVAEFYSGKTITMVVGSAAGGGFDTYARLIARYMPQYIPGEPNIIVENMPGGGNRVAFNYLYNVAESDGTVIGNASGDIALAQLLGDPSIDFDLLDFNYLGMPDRLGVRALIVTDEWEREFDDLLDTDSEPMVIGTNAPGNTLHDSAELLQNVLGANLRIVDGYGGSGDLFLALEQGEIDGFLTSYHSAVAAEPAKFQSGELRVIVKFAEQDEGGEDIADVPSVYDYAESEHQRDLLFYGAGFPRSFIRIYFTPPGTPEERTEALATAFHLTLEDEEFLAEAEAMELDITPLSGDEVAEGLEDMLNMSDELLADLQEVLQIKFD